MIFLDTGAFIARYIKKDKHHEDALRFWRELSTSSRRLFTSNFVLDESFTLIGRRAGYSFAAQRAKNIYMSMRLTILRPDGTDELDAVGIFEKYADQEISFTDCISFILMKKHRINNIFTFDRHFEYAGFVRFPQIVL